MSPLLYGIPYSFSGDSLPFTASKGVARLYTFQNSICAHD